MSGKYSAVPPPGFVQISGSSNNTSSNDGFAMPLPPTRPSTNSQTTRKRKSRFSDAPPSAEAPPPIKVLTDLPIPPQKKASMPVTDKSALVSAAAAAAARINANLKVKGKMKDDSSSTNVQLTSQSTVSSSGSDLHNPVDAAEIRRNDDMYATEVEINDMPIGCRNYLTRLSTQESINKSCLAYVSTRGKFMTFDEKRQQSGKPGAEKPLYLFIQGQNELNVQKALDRVRQIINNHYEKKYQMKSVFQNQALAQIASLSQKSGTDNTGTAPSVPNTAALAFTPGYPLIPTNTTVSMPHAQPALPSGNFVQEKLFIGLDGLPDQFDLKTKLTGLNYRNFNFISNQTGARVILRGKGSGFIEPTSGREAFEPMYAFISHPNQAGVDAAKNLVKNLMETVKTEIPPSMMGMMSQGHGNGSQGFYTGDYSNVPPPAVLAPHTGYQYPMTCQPTQMAAYPMQQFSAGMPTQTNVLSTIPYNYGGNYTDYQHNFSENKKSRSSDDSTLSQSTEEQAHKERSKKRFTEGTETTSLLSHDAKGKSDERVATGSSLPFWMTP